MKNNFNYLLTGILLGSMSLVSSCGNDDTPPPEEPEEEITQVTLTFTPIGGGTPVTAIWFDSDGSEGPIEPTAQDIVLATDVQYTLSMTLENTLTEEAEEQNVTAEIIREDDEHQFFFAWSGGIFGDPAGTGNIIPRTGDSSRPTGVADGTVNYEDEDDNGNPLGLQTSWRTATNAAQGVLRIVLKHQPPLVEGGAPQKSDTSNSDTGEDDIDIDFAIDIQ